MLDMQSRQEKIQQLKEALGQTRLDQGVVESNLGISENQISPNLLSHASAKLLRIHRGEQEPDDRDNLKHSDFLNLEDFIAEHIEKDAGKLLRKAKVRMDQKKNLSWLHAGFFTPQIRSVVIGNALSQNAEGINPLETFDVSHRVTKLGEGGISVEGIPRESRFVNASSFGLFDALKNIESSAIGVTNYFARNVAKGKDRKIYKLLRNTKTGNLEWVSHDKMLNSKVKIPDHQGYDKD